MGIQFVPQSFVPDGQKRRSNGAPKKRKRRFNWLMFCSWHNDAQRYFFLPSSSPGRSLAELLATNESMLIIWKSVSLKPDYPPTMESLKLLPAADEQIIKSMGRAFKKRIVWKQLEAANNGDE